MRVLKWIVDRCHGNASAKRTPLGHLPTAEALDTDGLSLSKKTLNTLLEVDRAQWIEAAHRQTEFFSKFGERLPHVLLEEQHALLDRLKAWKQAPVPAGREAAA